MKKQWGKVYCISWGAIGGMQAIGDEGKGNRENTEIEV